MVEKRKKKVNIIKRVTGYLKDVRVELTKVAWPTRQEVTAFTIVVLVTVLFFSLFVGSLDFLFAALVRIFSQR